jgi:dihydrofolate reductase
VAVVAEDGVQRVAAMRQETGKDIWLFGGGELFRLLLQHGCVDTVEPAIIPVLLGGGRPLLAPPAIRSRLSLTGHRVYPSGIVWLEYSINHA